MSDALTRLTAALSDRYRIERELGQGGMATVYLAEDLKHQRRVAIKVLRPELAAVIGADRFLREIKTIANLQHPHILGLIDSGEVNGTAYYVMPFVEGESLRDRLGREKQLPIADAVRIATEVAAALDYAHRHGVIHRDIKPENVMLHDGSALVTDFGIALAVSSAGSTRMTETGMSLGTPHYMSPEQAMGEREITARSDVYALGVVTYEMLIGEPPFTGPTAQAIVAKVMTEKPASLTTRRERVPPSVEAAVLTALEKLPADRFASAAAFASALTDRDTTAVLPRIARRRSIGTAGLLALAAAIAIAAFLAGRWNRSKPTSTGVPSRLAVLAPTVGLGGGSGLLRQLTITPQGDAIIYGGTNARSDNVLFFQRLDAAEPSEIPGSGTLRSTAISRDGRSMVAHSLSAAFRLPPDGGTQRQLPARVGAAVTGTWSPDGSYWFTEGNASGLSQLTPDDSVIPLARDLGRGLRIMQVMDDARTALVVRAPPGTATGPALLLDLRNGELTPLLDGPVVEVRSAVGELLTVLPDGSITATSFDPRTHRLSGSPVQVGTGVSLSGTGVANFAVADNGTIAYIPESPRSLMLVDRSGAMRPALEDHRAFHAPKFSPDGTRLSFDLTGGDGRDVWTLDLAQRTLSRATFNHDGHDAGWTPDGRFLTYISFKSGILGILRTRPGSTAPAESLIASNHLTYSGVWSRDGRSLITTGNDLNGSSGGDIALVENGGRGPIRPLVASLFQETYSALSPDNRWLAYVSDQSGQQEVYVRPLEGEVDPVQVSQEGGTEPVWAPSGTELFYRGTREGKTDLIAATVRLAPDFSVIGRRPLFPVSDMSGAAPHANYDISPDGRTFAMIQRSPATRIIVIQNLPALVARLRSTRGAAP